MKSKRRVRRNPLDGAALGALRVPIGCVVALTELDEMGARVSIVGDYILVDTRSSGSAAVLVAAERARYACGRVVVYDSVGTTMKTIRAEIVRWVARTFYVSRWDERQEGKRWYRDPFDVAPATPTKARKFAAAFVKKFEDNNDGLPVEVAYLVAAQMSGRHLRQPSEEEFGFSLAMEAMGHGVGWGDNHPKHGFKVPYAEYY